MAASLNQRTRVFGLGASLGESTTSRDYTLGPGGTFDVEFSNLTSGQYDNILVGGDVNINGGSLTVLPVGNFFFGTGVSLEVISVAGTLSGTFDGSIGLRS